MSKLTAENLASSLKAVSTNPEQASLLDKLAKALPVIVAGGSITSEIVGKSGPSSADAGSNQLVIVKANDTVKLTAEQTTIVDAQDNTTLTLDDGPGASKVEFKVVLGGGDNTVTDAMGPTLIDGTTGNDTILSTGGHDTINLGSGADLVYAGEHSSITAGSGHDTIFGGLFGSSRDTINSGNHTSITLSFGDNLVFGSGADDTIHAGAGHDTIYAGAESGKDEESIYGGGATSIYLQANDVVFSTGHDSIFGGDGKDTVHSEAGARDFIEASKSALTVDMATNAKDSIFGTAHGGDVANLGLASTDIETNKTKTNADGSKTIHFKTGQTLEVHNVTITFSNDVKEHF